MGLKGKPLNTMNITSLFYDAINKYRFLNNKQIIQSVYENK